MSIAVTFASKGSVVETNEGQFVNPGDNTTSWTGMNTEATLGAATVPPVTKFTMFAKSLVAGAATIDLTSLPDANGNAGAVTFLGLKVALMKLINPSTNLNQITVAKGASNGHTGFGSAFSVTLQPGAEMTFKGFDNAADVGSGDKTLDLSGTGTQQLDVELVAG